MEDKAKFRTAVIAFALISSALVVTIIILVIKPFDSRRIPALHTFAQIESVTGLKLPANTKIVNSKAYYEHDTLTEDWLLYTTQPPFEDKDLASFHDSRPRPSFAISDAKKISILESEFSMNFKSPSIVFDQRWTNQFWDVTATTVRSHDGYHTHLVGYSIMYVPSQAPDGSPDITPIDK